MNEKIGQVMNIISRTDIHLFHWLFKKTNHKNCILVRAISHTGDGHYYLILGIVLWFFEQEDGAIFLYTALLAYALELPLYLILKKCFKRDRPCDSLANLSAHISPSDKFSLPSGHTAAAFLMAYLLAHYYPSVTYLVYTWASLIGLSRILLGVHYPTDILAGAALGFSMSAAGLHLFVILT